ncbi:MAG: NAD(P)H-hydrate dehydratase [Bdellovibrionales bacterium]
MMKAKVYSARQAWKDLPGRKPSDNKTHGGKTLVIAGSPGLRGASILTATAAARCGAGYVYLSGEKMAAIVLRHPDFLQTSLRPSTAHFQNFSAAALGPGLQNVRTTKAWILNLARRYSGPVVLDAFALRALLQIPRTFRVPDHWVLTPHEGELALLLGTSSTWVRSHRPQAILQAQKRFGGIFLLKGSGTLVYDGHTLYQVGSGNVALAKAGTGDVLTGMIAGFLSQGLAPLKATLLASFTHGHMADVWVKKGYDPLSLMASDLLGALPVTLFRLRSKRIRSS